MNGHEAVAKRLISAGADLEVECDWILRSGVTPLHLAAGGGHEGLAKRLVSAGANIGSYY
ncbi:hypothetical protein HOY80DRAFT_977813 [Tuber brumale]|nr:hypothetical protein HOY80DRAFT_977813 [Tuber brumale]